ncbi:hypothetical protein LV89_00111 [Arcicella aurantiaca]|uniref:Uncharacterized protein n=1 Tax=Arcicella aurantiaca TaxID=591202 RepID=A0A316EHN6_9BACT|nr:hypothetical protein [Arcicella aurantiaca]PWK29271.1 hypothetical protein LV89_00111 [Arcicella aurantiaca]
MKILDELKHFWEVNNLPIDGGVKDKFNEVSIVGFSFKYPNLDGKALMLHDLNHLITGYKTNWTGECEVSAWELASGGRKGYAATWIYPISLVLIGMVICPFKTYKAFINGLGKRNSFIISNQTNIWKLTKTELITLVG